MFGIFLDDNFNFKNIVVRKKLRMQITHFVSSVYFPYFFIPLCLLYELMVCVAVARISVQIQELLGVTGRDLANEEPIQKQIQYEDFFFGQFLLNIRNPTICMSFNTGK